MIGLLTRAKRVETDMHYSNLSRPVSNKCIKVKKTKLFLITLNNSNSTVFKIIENFKNSFQISFNFPFNGNLLLFSLRNKIVVFPTTDLCP